MASTGTAKSTDLAVLGKLPLELRYMVYEHVMPQRILRVYRDWELDHVFIDALSVPDLALVCQETWEFCRRKYSKFTYHPVWVTKDWPPSPSTRRAMKPQVTWFCQSHDVLFLSTPHNFPKLRATPSNAVESKDRNSTEGDGKPSQTTMRGTTEPDHGGDWVCAVLAALADITRVTETLLYTEKHYNNLRVAMLPGLFPSLRQILFTAYIKAVPDHSTWNRREAVFVQRNIIQRPGEPKQRIKCTPLPLARPLDMGFNTGHSNKRVSDRPLIEMWNTKTFSKFSTQGCKERFPYSLPIHRDLVERQIAVAKHYWAAAYTVDADGSRVYPYYRAWERDVWANAPEVLACLPSVPEVVPVYLWMTG
ncbi:hypothetical protein PG993_003032 [Apiospora rasikravindrae]|uniref:2EXR domain-containing protein n=1 Tax=Apiospora rasikravindrae TaxID=990691 RepID=A0ABR1TYF1_9PEZI